MTDPLLLPVPRDVDLEDRTVSPHSERLATDGSIAPEGYRLTITRRHLDIESGDDAGLANARRTIAQLHELYGEHLPAGRIEDAPDLAVRGVMLDVSRDKVPSIETLTTLIDRLASWKINQVQLYTEHTFAYAGHEEVWRDASPYTAEEMRVLDEFCRRRFVELVPNQNCLGHMERWLRHDRYRPMALAPDGFDFMGDHRGPSTLDPTNPDALALVRGLLAELLPNFTSGQVNVGLDEPWELRPDRMEDYLAWVRSLRGAAELDGRQMLMWGDIVRDAASAAALPEGVTICEWGYDAGHPFADRGELLAEAGVPFWVCPGTSSWLTLGGRWTNARTNILEAVEAAVAHDAGGLLLADWGDLGHIQYLPISEPTFAFAAATSWCLASNRDVDVAAVLDAHCYADGAGELGALLLELGDAPRVLGAQMPNLSLLAAPLYIPRLQLGRGPAKGVTVEQYDEAAAILDGCRARLGRVRPERRDGPLSVNELGNAIELLALLCSDGRARLTEGAADGSVTSLSPGFRQRAKVRMDEVIERHRRVWTARNRPGGLDDSCARLARLRTIYETGSTDGLPFFG